MMSKLVFRASFILLLFAGCSELGLDNKSDSKKDNKEDTFIDRRIDLKTASSGFTTSESRLSLDTVSEEAMNTLFQCETPHTQKRIKSDEIKVNFSVDSKIQHNFDGQFETKVQNYEYTTETKNAIFIRLYKLVELIVNGTPILSEKQPQLSYKDTCTSSGCTETEREYIEGSAEYLLRIDAKLSEARRNAELLATSDCHFQPDFNQKSEEYFQRGSYGINEHTSRAVRYTKIEQGDIFCRNKHIDTQSLSNGKIHMGKAERTLIQVSLADKVPYLNAPELHKIAHAPCDATPIYQKSYVSAGDVVFFGYSTEITGFKLEAEVQTVEDYQLERENYRKHLETLERAVNLARSELIQAEYSHTAAVKTSEAAWNNYNELEWIAAISEEKAKLEEATPEEKEQALKDRAAANASKTIAERLSTDLQAAEELLQIARSKYERAEMDYEEARQNPPSDFN